MKIQIDKEKLVLMPVDKLNPNQKNRNKHSPEQIDRLCDLIKYQGFRQPIIVSNRSGLIVVGHGRLEAAKKLGMPHVPVIFQDFDSEESEYAFGVSDNAIASWAELDLSGINADLPDLGPDFDIDLLGIKNFEIDILPPEPQCDEDEVGEPPAEPRTKPGDLYVLGKHRLLCGDSTSADDVEKLFDGATAELCFTSPPYADQREYNGGKELSTEHLATFIRAAFGKVRYFAVNLGYARKDGEVYPYWDDYIKEAKDCGLKFLSWNIWDKGECGSIGNQSAMFGIRHEWIFVFGSEIKKLNRTVPNKSAGHNANHSGNRQKDGSIKKGRGGLVGECRQLDTILNQTPLKARNHGIDHPAMFPVEFPENYYEGFCSSGDHVYEPFGGSGTSMIAAENQGLKSLVMELDPKYCDVIVSRYLKYTGQSTVILNGEEVRWDG